MSDSIEEKEEYIMDESSIRLKSSSDPVDPDRLPDELIESIIETIKENTDDPIAIIATLGNMFSGLRVNDIRDRLVLTDNGRVYHPSREFVRKKVVGICLDIQRRYTNKTEHGSVSPVYPERNIDPSVIQSGPLIEEEDDKHASNKENEANEIPGLVIKKKKTRGTKDKTGPGKGKTKG